MNFQANFGRVGKPKFNIKESERFRLAVLGDFSGRANKGELETGDALAKRKPLKVNFDNIDDVIARLGIEFNIPVGANSSVRIKINSMDDFHPDELYENLEIFEEISSLRDRLRNTSTFASAAKEVQEWLGDEALLKTRRNKARSRGATIPVNGKLDDFAKLVGRPTVEHSGDELSSLENLLKNIVAPFIKPSADPEQESMVAAVDNALSGMMRSILHNPDFQELESLWRSVDLLTRSLETDVGLQIVLFDVTAEEIAADLSGDKDLTETGLYKLLIEQPALDANQGTLSTIAACYTFEQTAPHAELLGRIAQIVAQTHTAFLTSVGSDCLKKINSDDTHPLIKESWGALRSMPEAVYLGLTAPRFMLRNTYGKKTDPIDPFEFEEFTIKDGLRSILWGNSAILAALLLGRSFSEQGLKGMDITSNMNIGEIPFHYYNDEDGDQIALPCTDRLLTMSLAEHAISQGFIPMLSIKGQHQIRLGSWVSVAGEKLAGAWAPVKMPEPEPEPEPISDDLPAEDVEEEASQAQESGTGDDFNQNTEEESDDDMDDLLASLSDDNDDDQNTEEESDDDMDDLLASLSDDNDDDQNTEEESDDDMDDLLASLSDDNDDDDDDDMDPELAALLADL